MDYQYIFCTSFQFGMVFQLTGRNHKFKHMKRKFNVIAALLITTSFVFFACSKENTDRNGTNFKVLLTDNPALYDSVNIDIREVRVNFNDDSSGNNPGWINMSTNAGVYNLLTLQNGVDTLLATTNFPTPTQTLKQIRLILGPDNSVVVAGIRYPLTVPSGSQSGLKINLNKQLNARLDSVLIDFDAALSIHQTGNGTYMLKPVLKIK